MRRLFVGRTGKLQITPTVGVDKQTGSRLFQAWWLQVTGIAADGVMYVLQQAPGGAHGPFGIGDRRSAQPTGHQFRVIGAKHAISAANDGNGSHHISWITLSRIVV